jgi:hypothetical protein
MCSQPVVTTAAMTPLLTSNCLQEAGSVDNSVLPDGSVTWNT